MISAPLHLLNWISENRKMLKPPVGNFQIWQDREFMVTVVGGPNSREDYHINQGEEFFFQLEGDIVLKILKEGKPQEISIGEGEIFLLPPSVPHSPQRPPNTVGLVIERKRHPSEMDGLIWLCEKCENQLHKETFHLTDIVVQLPVVLSRFTDDKRLCGKCGWRTESRPEPRKEFRV